MTTKATHWGQYPKGLDSPERTASERIQSLRAAKTTVDNPTGKVRRVMRIPSPPFEVLLSLTATLDHGLPTLSEVNHRLESRMRENRSYGSEGGGSWATASPYPYQRVRHRHPTWMPAFAGMTTRELGDVGLNGTLPNLRTSVPGSAARLSFCRDRR